MATFQAKFLEKDESFRAEFGSTHFISGDKFFEFSQRVPSDRWEILHPLKKFPSVTIIDTGGSVVIGEIEYIDESNIVITFQAAFAGKAYLN